MHKQEKTAERENKKINKYNCVNQFVYKLESSFS